MKNVRFLFIFVAVIAILLTACGAAPAAEPAPVVEQPPAAEPTTAPPAAAPVESAAPAEPAQPQYAPFCEAAAATGCEAPAVQMLDNKYCIEKVPYAIMSVPAGTTYESLDPDMECVDQMHSDGNLRVTCHSSRVNRLVSYDLKVCNGACSAPVSGDGHRSMPGRLWLRCCQSVLLCAGSFRQRRLHNLHGRSWLFARDRIIRIERSVE